MNLEKHLKILGLKDEERTGWQIYNVEDPETVAGHSWNVALLTILHLPDELDMEKALKVAAVHDLGEALTGDKAFRAPEGVETGVKNGDITEREAVARLLPENSNELERLHQEYEDRETAEAKFVKDMDLIDLCLQALKYHREDRAENPEEIKFDDLDEFFETSRERFNTEKGLEIFREIEEEYEREKQSL